MPAPQEDEPSRKSLQRETTGSTAVFEYLEVAYGSGSVAATPDYLEAALAGESCTLPAAIVCFKAPISIREEGRLYFARDCELVDLDLTRCTITPFGKQKKTVIVPNVRRGSGSQVGTITISMFSAQHYPRGTRYVFFTIDS